MLEGTNLQADITLGNIASALSIHTEEAALIAELQAGSEEAFSWLITRYHQPIYSLLARTVRGGPDSGRLRQDFSRHRLFPRRVFAAHLDLSDRTA